MSAAAHRWRKRPRASLLEAPGRFMANALAPRLLRLAYGRTATLRMLIALTLGGVWLGAGITALVDPWPASVERPPFFSALFEPVIRNVCLLQGGETCDWADPESDWRLHLSQLALALLTLITLLFGFWTQFLSALARICRAIGAGHIVVVGAGEAAETLARDIARKKPRGSKTAKPRRSVMLVRRAGSDADVAALGADGVMLVVGPISQSGVLASAGAASAERIVAIDPSDSENLAAAAAAAAARKAGGKAPRPGDILVRIENPRLRSDLPNRDELHPGDVFSLPGLAARGLMRALTPLQEAQALGQTRVHVGIVGWESAVHELALAVFRLMWAPGFGDPKVTVFAPEAQAAEDVFRAAHPAAFEAGATWSPDISFREYAWDAALDPWETLAAAEGDAPFSVLVVALPTAGDTLAAAAARARKPPPPLDVKGRPNSGRRRVLLVRESVDAAISTSLRSDAPGAAIVEPFAPLDRTATSRALIDRQMDEAARAVHWQYLETCVVEDPRLALEYCHRLAEGSTPYQRFRRFVSSTAFPVEDDLDVDLSNVGDEERANILKLIKELRENLEQEFSRQFGPRALARCRERFALEALESGEFTPDPERPAQAPWDELAEHYLVANRAQADHVFAKLRVLGWSEADADQTGTPPPPAPDNIPEELAETEHKRWVAEKILSGWRSGPRNDLTRHHPDIRPYATFPPEKLPAAIAKDRDTWKNAPGVGSMLAPQGFVSVRPLSTG